MPDPAQTIVHPFLKQVGAKTLMRPFTRAWTWIRNWLHIPRSVASLQDEIEQLHGTVRDLRGALDEVSATTGSTLAVTKTLKRNTAQLTDALARLDGQNRAALGAASLAARQARQGGSGPGPLRIAFLVHNVETWLSLRPVYSRMQDDARFEPVVFSIPRRFPGAEEFRDEDLTSAALSGAGVAHVRLNDTDPYRDLDRLRAHGIDAIFRQSHWSKDVPAAFDSLNLSFARQYYVPYEIATISMHGVDYLRTYHHDLCDRAFVACDLLKEMMEIRDPHRRANITVSGHPKVPEILGAAPDWPIHSGNTKRLLWSAHHAVGTGWNNFGVFPDIFGDMLALAKRRPDLDILFSPHPALMSVLQGADPPLAREIEAFFEDWAALPNTGHLQDGPYTGAFKASDLLIVDGLSFLIEYQLNEKPVINLVRPDRSELNPIGDMVMAGAHPLPVADIGGLERLIDRIHAGDVAPKQAAQASLKALFTAQPDPAGTILDAVWQDCRDSHPG